MQKSAEKRAAFCSLNSRGREMSSAGGRAQAARSTKSSNANTECAALKALRNAGVVAITVTTWSRTVFPPEVFAVM